MSAFVVDDKTINRVVTYLRDDRDLKDWFGHQVSKRLDISILSQDGLAQLARLMHVTNVQAVQQRYPDEPAETLPGPIREAGEHFHFRYELTGRMQALKSLQCWLYQCAEGNVPESAVYRLMERVKAEMALAIVSDLPEYERAEWG